MLLDPLIAILLTTQSLKTFRERKAIKIKLCRFEQNARIA